MRLADYVFQRLVEVGATHIYGVSGRGALFLTDAVAKSEAVTYVAMHHEQGAGYAAVAHTDYSNSPGVCLVSTGCASTNAITPVLSAWQDGIGTFFISGQNVLNETSNFTQKQVRTFGQQEADIIPIVESITKYAAMVQNPNDIGIIMDEAIYNAMNGRKGPVWIDIPLDLQSASVNPEILPRASYKSIEAAKISTENLLDVASNLRDAKRPLILIGSGTKEPLTKTLINKILTEFEIPVVYSASAVDVADSSSQLVIGSVGMMACSRAGNFAIQNADYLLVLGNRLTSMTTGVNASDFAPRAVIDVVDIDPVEHSKHNLPIRNLIESDCGEFLDLLIPKLDKSSKNPWLETLKEWKTDFSGIEPHFDEGAEVDLYQLAGLLSEFLSNSATLITDSGLNELILPPNVSFRDSQRCIHPASQGAMGFSLPAAVGAHFSGASDITVVVGDGSLMMNIQELETIRNYNILLKIIVVNNNAYAVIRKRQQELFRNRTIGTDPENGVSIPNLQDVAMCFGLKYVLIENTSQLKQYLEANESIESPVLLEVMGKHDQDYIQVTQMQDENKRLVRLPIDNQHPLIDPDRYLRLKSLPGNVDR